MPRIDPEKMDAITKRGYNPRNIVYLPFEKDPLNIGNKSRTLGMTLPEGTTWEYMAEHEKGKHKEGAIAVRDFINENYTGEDREYMQANAQYINAITLIEDEPGEGGLKNPFNKIETEKHEVAHKVVEEGVAGLEMSQREQEFIIRLHEVRTGNEETKKRALNYLKSAGKSQEEVEKKYGLLLDAIGNVAGDEDED